MNITSAHMVDVFELKLSLYVYRDEYRKDDTKFESLNSWILLLYPTGGSAGLMLGILERDGCADGWELGSDEG